MKVFVPAVGRSLLVISLVILIGAGLVWLRASRAPLDAIVHGGGGPPSVVLLHGYGSRAEDWIQFESRFSLPPHTRLIYLQGPLRTPWSGRRGWWWLNLNGHKPPGEPFADYSKVHPRGIRVASRLVRNHLATIAQPIILGGFSQGAMTSAEVAFNSDQRLAGLILLGGTTVNEEGWAERFAQRRDLPIFIAHGRRDSVLPFAQMEKFAERLRSSGLDVTWLPFDGDHGIPEQVVAGMNAFVRHVVQRSRAQ